MAYERESLISHVSKNLALVALSFLVLPLSLFRLFVSFLFISVSSFGEKKRTRKEKEDGNEAITILVTGVSMQKGLTLTRIFSNLNRSRSSSAGTHGSHKRLRIIGADFSALAMGRFSRSVDAFYRLQAPQLASGIAGTQRYIDDLLRIVKTERVNLWVSCSGVASAVEDGVARDAVVRETGGRCRCVQFGEAETELLHEKASFIKTAAEAGLPVPETRVVRSAEEANHALAAAATAPEGSTQRRRYIIKPLLVSDAFRGDMTLLPLATERATRSHVATLPISHATPFIVQEFIRGPEYCTHALVVKGSVEAFVACPSASILMHYDALPSRGVLAREMLAFTRIMAAELQKRAEARNDDFTGHLSFDFLVRQEDLENPDETGKLDLWPIECNPRTHTAVVHFQDGEAGDALARAYLKIIEGDTAANGSKETARGRLADERDVLYGSRACVYRWLPHDAAMLFYAMIGCVWRRGSDNSAWPQLRLRLERFAASKYKDATLDWSDPLPAFVLWHVYWPSKLVGCIIRGKRWSAINVSTGKIFEI